MIASLEYMPVEFTFEFKKPVRFDIPPLYLVRSVLGNQLRRMCCISHGTQCPSCIYNKTCVYAAVFETIIDKAVGLGRDRASHPYVFSVPAPVSQGQELRLLTFTMTLLGKYIDYLPYIYGAFLKAGKFGVGRDRVGFAVACVRSREKMLSENFGSYNEGEDEPLLRTDFEKSLWTFAGEEDLESASDGTGGDTRMIRLVSPLRFKTAGKYTADFDASAFMACLFRRMKTLCSLYGRFEGAEVYDGAAIRLRIENRSLTWNDYTRYSARQKCSMKIGGLTGSFCLKGETTRLELAMLEFAELFNAGKNTNFGLGQIEIWRK